jgi:hypothetical protein
LGFAVAPDGKHPFGTANCCIYFEDGTFLEPLAVADAAKCAEAARKGNVFVARDQAFRFRRGGEGFSALVLTTRDAAVDHSRFCDAGMSAGRMLRFSRAARDKDGNWDRASFRLAFAADLRSPDAYFFTCERVNVPSIDMSGLRAHANAVTGISAVIASEPVPGQMGGFLAELSGSGRISTDDGRLELSLGAAKLTVLDRKRLKTDFGLNAGHARGLRLRAILFKSADMKQTLSAIENSGTNAHWFGERLVIPAEPGQGAAFAFEGSRCAKLILS